MASVDLYIVIVFSILFIQFLTRPALKAIGQLYILFRVAATRADVAIQYCLLHRPLVQRNFLHLIDIVANDFYHIRGITFGTSVTKSHNQSIKGSIIGWEDTEFNGKARITRIGRRSPDDSIPTPQLPM